MREKAIDQRKRPRLLTMLVLALVFFIVVGVPARMLANLYVHLDALSANARSGDLRAVRTELGEVTRFYERARVWGLEWVADYVLKDALLQRATAAYLAGEYQTVVTDLERHNDDPRAAHLLGCAKFRIAQRRYREFSGRDAKSMAQKKAIVQEVLDLINSDFERAVRTDTRDTFAYKWDYDLTSDAAAITRAMELPRQSEPPELEQRLGEKSPVRRRRG